jgi:hypothetical protein
MLSAKDSLSINVDVVSSHTPNPPTKTSQLRLRPLSLSHNCHDASAYLTGRQLECLVRRTLFVVKVVVAVIFEDGLRHYRVALAERRGGVEDFAGGVGDYIGRVILRVVSEGCAWDRSSRMLVIMDELRTLLASFLRTS